MFLGIDMFSGKYSMAPNYFSVGTLTEAKLSNGTYNHFYLSADPNKTVQNIYDDWEFYTKINANYNESMDGGNTGFSLKNTDTIIIKRREHGTMDWVTVFTIPVNKLEDFNFMKEYNYGRADTHYDFMLISSIGGIQNSYEFSECKSDFEGICITDKDHFFKTIYNVEPIDITENNNESILNMLNNTYPVIVSNGCSNYSSGSVSAVFLKIENCDAVSRYQATKYRNEIMSWLTNKKAKILKLDNGTLKMIRVVGNPSETDGGHPELKNINFDFVEIGDSNDENSLYRNNLSDVEANKW